MARLDVRLFDDFAFFGVIFCSYLNIHPKITQVEPLKWSKTAKMEVISGNGGRMMTLLDWQDRFGSNEACAQYLFDHRWPNGFVCPECQGTTYWTIRRANRTTPLYECTACHHQASVTAGTIFHRTKVALRVWFLAIFLVAVDKGGKSALALSRELGLSYPTAWLLHHKIQQAMADRNAQYQ